MTGKEMRELVSTGTCPQCKSALSNRNRVDNLVVVGDCEVCNIAWCGTELSTPARVEASPKWKKM